MLRHEGARKAAAAARKSSLDGQCCWDATEAAGPPPPPPPEARGRTAAGQRGESGRVSTESEVYDDGTNTFFWRAHTLTVLFILTCSLGYVTLLEETPQDTAYNIKSALEKDKHVTLFLRYYRNVLCSNIGWNIGGKRERLVGNKTNMVLLASANDVQVYSFPGSTHGSGHKWVMLHPTAERTEKHPPVGDPINRGIVASILVFLCFGVTQAKDGPFSRPHPAYWRFWLCVSVVYELFLIFILFQTVHDGRQFMKFIDPKLGVPLPERDYGGNCLIYDPGNETDPYHNLWDKMDGFVPAHFLGWYIKTLMIRDWWMCMMISVMFEFLEYSFEHQLPNFSECWWDHWIMDVLVCNGFGIYCGMKTLKWLSMKPYKWQGLWNIPTYSWVKFEWRPASNLRRWLSVCGLIFLFLLAELNTFYLKFVLWMPPEHYLVLLRLVFFVNVGGVAMREIYDFMDDLKFHKKLGQQAWMVAAITVTEFLIVIKYDTYTITLPLPFYVTQCWILGILLVLIWTAWRFFIRDITLRYKEIRRQKQEYKPEDVSLRNGEATSDLASRNISKPKRL
ncbi:hypothetical protein FKM82_003427 [Ascaphus truei]